MSWIRKVVLGATLLCGASAVCGGPSAYAAQGTAKTSSPDGQIQADVLKALSGKRFEDVHAGVQGGNVMLTGSVPTYADKEDADKKVHHRKGVLGVNNLIQVAGPEVSDPVLRAKLAQKLAYDRVGYGTTTFNSLTIAVQDGVVTLGGTAYGPTDKDSALSLVANYPGVKDVVDNIEVAPLSPNDDRIRLAEAQAIYRFPTLNKYALDPAKPIRITVVNGHVILTGVVDSQADKDVAGLRAKTVAGAFTVANDLQVAGVEPESGK